MCCRAYLLRFSKMKLKRQELVSEGSLQRLVKSAQEPLRRCDYDQAIEIVERARRLAPGDCRLLLDLGSVHLKAHNFEAAEQCFEKAIQTTPEKTRMMATAGVKCFDSQKYDLAERFLQRSIAQRDAAPIYFVRLAEIYERRHELDQANQCIERALHMDPRWAPAMLARARISRQRGDIEEAEQILRAMEPAADPTVQTNVLYQLGEILDRQGRYDEAMNMFIAAKAARQSEAEPYRAKARSVRQRFIEMQKGLTAGMVKRWLEFRKDLQPEHRIVLLGGHGRSGTTVLEQVLDSHPEIASAEETDLFHNRVFMPMGRKLPEDAPLLSIIESPDVRLLQRVRRNYFRAMPGILERSLENKLLVDKNPHLTLLLPAVIRAFPEIKLIIALRDPRDICVSRFTRALAIDQLLGWDDIVETYVEIMSIWLTLKPWLENYIEVHYEDVVEDLESQARKMLEFLGVPWDAGVLQFHEHARKKLIRSPNYVDVAKPMFKTAKGRWRNYQKYLEPYLDQLEPFVKEFGYA